VHEVWGLDIVMSTGTGRPQQDDERNTNVFKRAVEQQYKLKMKASRGVYSEITKKSVPPLRRSRRAFTLLPQVPDVPLLRAPDGVR
jgi:hypothetical protein